MLKTTHAWGTNERTVIESEDLPISADQFEVGSAEPGVKSEGGSFNPYLLELRGPTALLDQITTIELEGQSHQVQRAFDGRYYVIAAPPPGTMTAMAAGAGPRVVLLMPSTASAPISPLESADFFLGYALGFAGGGVDVVVGAVKLVGLIVVEGIRFSPAGFAYVTTFGDKYESETRVVKGAATLAMQTAQIVAELQADRDEFLFDLLTFQWNEAALVSEPYRLALSYGAELINALWEEYLNLPRREQGRLLGRAVFELASVAVAYAKVGAIEKLTKVQFLEALRARPFFQHPQRLYHVHYRRGGRASHHRAAAAATLADEADQDDEEGDVEELVATGEHPFYVLERNAFVAARDLVEGETLSLADGATAIVVGVTTEDPKPGEILTTYNIEVDEFHTYFVGESGVWVHNAAGRECQQVRAIVERLKQRGKTPNEIMRTLEKRLKKADLEFMLKVVDEIFYKDALASTISLPREPSPLN